MPSINYGVISCVRDEPHLYFSSPLLTDSHTTCQSVVGCSMLAINYS